MEEGFSYKMSFNKDEFKDLITKMIFIAQALGFPQDNWLTEKELELLVEMTRQYYLGISLSSRESIEEIIDNTSFSGKDKGIYIYRGHLKNKGWIQATQDGIELIPFLTTLDPNAEETELEVSLKALNHV